MKQSNDDTPRIVYLTGKPVSREMLDILNRLSKGDAVSMDEIDATNEMRLARTHVANSIETFRIAGREEEQDRILERLNEAGSAYGLDGNGRVMYNGDVKRESRLDIVIGLPASGKSSAIVDTISQEFGSRIVDNDEAKKMIPEFNSGWGAGVVHKESQKISDKQFLLAIKKHENIVLPKVGSDTVKMQKIIDVARGEGYTVYLHYVELSRNKALGRIYEMLKKGGVLDGYSKWNNDVDKGERPLLIEADCSGEFIRKAEESQTVSADPRDHGERRQGRGTGERLYTGESGALETDELGGTMQDHRSALRRSLKNTHHEAPVGVEKKGLLDKLKYYRAIPTITGGNKDPKTKSTMVTEQR